MDSGKAYSELKRLVEKYVSNESKKKELLGILQQKQYMPPVRGIVDDLFKQENHIDKEDMDLIDELMYNYG